jgi:hypothetical protein
MCLRLAGAVAEFTKQVEGLPKVSVSIVKAAKSPAHPSEAQSGMSLAGPVGHTKRGL